MTPPQSPLLRAPGPFSEVKTIGVQAVPFAINLAPLVMTRLPRVELSPLIIVPGWIVKVELLVTYIIPTRIYTFVDVNVLFVVMLLFTITLAPIVLKTPTSSRHVA